MSTLGFSSEVRQKNNGTSNYARQNQNGSSKKIEESTNKQKSGIPHWQHQTIFIVDRRQHHPDRAFAPAELKGYPFQMDNNAT